MPDVSNSEQGTGSRVISLESLVRMKLTAFRDIDRVHVYDLFGVGQIDHSWPARFSPVLAAWLQEILDNPNG